MFPFGVESALRNETFRRADPDCVQGAVGRLGVRPSGLFIRFFETFTGGYQSTKFGYLLLDLCEGAPTIVEQTETARARHRFPAQCVVISDLEGGAVLVYDCGSDAVFVVDFEGGVEELIAGTLVPRWSSFEVFLNDFF